MRDRLIELLKKAELKETYIASNGKPVTSIHRRIVDMSEVSILADHLLENGVVVPPCKVGDKVYIVAEVTKKIIECTVIGVWICKGNCSIITDHGVIYSLSLEETVFLTREEAEQELGKLQASYEQVKGGAE